MVNFKDMVKVQKSSHSDSLSALKSRRPSVMDTAHKEFKGGKALDLPAFKRVIRILLKDANDEAVKHGRRRVHVPSSKELNVAFKHADIDKSGAVDEKEFVAFFMMAVEGRLPKRSGFKIYSRPTLIRNWDEHDVHPEQDWQDLFYDLLFVAGAFKVGNFLVDSMVYNPHQFDGGVRWFLVIFMVIAQQWFMKLNIKARFQFQSLFHGTVFDTLELITVAFAIWNIPAAYIYVDVSNAKDAPSLYASYSFRSTYSSYSSYSSAHRSPAGVDVDAGLEKFSTIDQLRYNVQSQSFAFSVFIALNNVLHIIKWCEVLNMEDITNGAKTIARFMVATYTVIGLLFAAAACVAYNSTDTESYENYGSSACIYLWLSGVIVHFVFFQGWAFFLNHVDDYHENTVPLCVDYVIHRIGEFAMLIIGETVLSLLTVPVEDEVRSYLMFGCGMLIATHLCFQHFAVYPTNPKDHALRSAKFNHAGVLYLFLMFYVYAPALILIGVGCKCLLKFAPDNNVFEHANWILAYCLLVAFLCMTFFSVLHNQTYIEETIRSRGKNITWANVRQFTFVLLSALTFVPIAVAGMTPSLTVYMTCAVVIAQSFLLVNLDGSSLSDAHRPDAPPAHEAQQRGTQHARASEVFNARVEFNRVATQIDLNAGEVHECHRNQVQEKTQEDRSPPESLVDPSVSPASPAAPPASRALPMTKLRVNSGSVQAPTPAPTLEEVLLKYGVAAGDHVALLAALLPRLQPPPSDQLASDSPPKQAPLRTSSASSPALLSKREDALPRENRKAPIGGTLRFRDASVDAQPENRIAHQNQPQSAKGTQRHGRPQTGHSLLGQGEKL